MTHKLLVSFLFALLPASHACGFVPQWELQWVKHYARGFGLDYRLVAALIYEESDFCQHKVSPKGAIGLGQLMPATARGMGIDPRDPVHNIYGTVRHLRGRWDEFGDWHLAIAAYNAGSGAVKKHGGIPPFQETQDFVTDVLNRYWAYVESGL